MNQVNVEELVSYSTRQLKDLHQELFGATPSTNNKGYLVRKIQKHLRDSNAQVSPSSPQVPATPAQTDDVTDDTTHSECVAGTAIEPEAQPAELVAEQDSAPTDAPTELVPAGAKRRRSQARVVTPIQPLLEPSESNAGEAHSLVPTRPRRTRRSFRAPGTRDPRLPPAGTVLTREFKGRTYTVTVLEEGFEYAGKQWNSLSGIAKEITGIMWNGLLFWGLTPPPARPSPATAAQPSAGPILDSQSIDLNH